MWETETVPVTMNNPQTLLWTDYSLYYWLLISLNLQIEDMRENHEASLMEMETTHNDTLATLQEEHARTVKSKHLQPVALFYSALLFCTSAEIIQYHVISCVRSENGTWTADKVSGGGVWKDQTVTAGKHFSQKVFRIGSLLYSVTLSEYSSGPQDQVDTMTFQNSSLRDRAKRFEEALRRSTDEQIVVTAAWYSLGHYVAFFRGSDQLKPIKVVLIHLLCCCQEALAPYKHIEEDLKSLKEVLEMKNHQIHQQALKISELEKIVGFKFLLLLLRRWSGQKYETRG